MGRTRKENRFKSRIKDELNTYNNILDKAGRIVSIVPRIEELKEEAEAKLLAANELPEDMLEELTPRLLTNQDWDFASIRSIDQSLPVIDPSRVLYYSTSGSSSDITTTIIENYPEPDSRPIWATNVIDRFSEIADLSPNEMSSRRPSARYQQISGRNSSAQRRVSTRQKPELSSLTKQLAL